LNDPRVRWLDSIGISKEQRMYAQNGEAHVSSSQHFHGFCREKDLSDPSRTMNVCSNITEMVGQLLLGHALGPKDEFLEQIKQAPKPGKQRATWCHHCPKCMLPFHIQPYPEMECVEGPLTAKEESVDCSGTRESGGNTIFKNPLECPDTCLATEAVSSFATESDTVYVRQCPI